MSTKPLLQSNYAHLMAVTNVKGLRINGHYDAINPPTVVQH